MSERESIHDPEFSDTDFSVDDLPPEFQELFRQAAPKRRRRTRKLETQGFTQWQLEQYLGTTRMNDEGDNQVKTRRKLRRQIKKRQIA